MTSGTGHWRNSKYAKAKGRSNKGADFVQLFHYLIDTPQFAKLSGSGLKLLVDITRQYNGYNNGDLSISTSYMKRRWLSNAKKKRARDELIAAGWIIETRKGGMRMGPDLYAITWKKIDECGGKHSMAPTDFPLNLWKENKKTTAPESGATQHPNQVLREVA